MDIRLSVNDKGIKVGIELASQIASWLPDYEEYQDIFHELAQHSSSSIRRWIATNQKITSETAKLLLRDKDDTVLQNILRSESVKDIFDDDDFKYILGTCRYTHCGIHYKIFDIIKNL